MNNTIQHRNVSLTFPNKLLDIIAGSRGVVVWAPHGLSFIITCQDRFIEEVLPKYFRHSKLTSFQRQLNLYGFRRITKGEDTGSYFHPQFRRDAPNLVKMIKRLPGKGATATAKNLPKFYGAGDAEANVEDFEKHFEEIKKNHLASIAKRNASLNVQMGVMQQPQPQPNHYMGFNMGNQQQNFYGNGYMPQGYAPQQHEQPQYNQFSQGTYGGYNNHPQQNMSYGYGYIGQEQIYQSSYSPQSAMTYTHHTSDPSAFVKQEALSSSDLSVTSTSTDSTYSSGRGHAAPMSYPNPSPGLERGTSAPKWMDRNISLGTRDFSISDFTNFQSPIISSPKTGSALRAVISDFNLSGMEQAVVPPTCEGLTGDDLMNQEVDFDKAFGDRTLGNAPQMRSIVAS